MKHEMHKGAKRFSQKGKKKTVVKHSIRTQIALIFIALLAGTLLCCWSLNSKFLGKYYISTKTEKINAAYEKIKEAAGGSFINKEELHDLTTFCFRDNVMFIIISQSEGVAYASPNGGEEFIGPASIFYNGGYTEMEPDRATIFSYQKSEYLTRAGWLENGNGYMLVTPIESIRDSADIANRFLIYTGVAMAVIGAIVIWLVTRMITDPILQLAHISERMAKLDFDAKYEGKTQNEIGLLGDNMNQLSTSLEKTISELKTANNELQRDIEKKEKIDQMRQEFLANVSHELKTPIALIQGYAEGLQEGINDDQESRQFYCDVIVDEAGKMNNMVKKLLTLNQLEFGNDTISMERFDIMTLIRNYVQSAKILTEGVDVRIESLPELYVWGDEFKVEEVFMNYFTNAVHYCKEKEGKKIIEVTVECKDGLARISVFNTGDPIPEESVPRLWEKFYKVDKARTREYGGSGVGLSIVKAIMESMNQKFGVENFTNGVKFWFELETVQETADEGRPQK